MSNTAKIRFIQIAQRHLGDWGEQFIVHQCKRLNMDINSLTPDNLRTLADSASKTTVVIIGKTRANRFREDLLKLADKMEKN